MSREIELRKAFLNVYTDFDKFLETKGFRILNTNTVDDYNHSMYDDYVKSMYAVECYKNDDLNIYIRFLRDTNEHKFLIIHVGEYLFPKMVRMPLMEELINELVENKLKEFFELLQKYNYEA